MANQPQPQPPSSNSTPQDIYLEPKFLKKNRKKQASAGHDHLWIHSNSLSTKDILSKIVPCPIPNLDQNFASKLSGRHIALHRSPRSNLAKDQDHSKVSSKAKKPRWVPASSRQARYIELQRLIDQEQKSYRYHHFVPLHSLWLGYMAELLGICLQTTSPAVSEGEPETRRVEPKLPLDLPPVVNIQAKLLKADYHGSLISVKRAKNPALVGVKGIVIQETQETFKLITDQDQIKVIPKVHCVFEIGLPLSNVDDDQLQDHEHESTLTKSLVFQIFGNQFAFKSADRVSKKFKPKGFAEL